jgi:hypothetical protein
MKGVFALACAILVLSGCATRPALEQADLLQITQGKTTRAEVEQLLGKPDDEVTGSNGRTLIVYQEFERDWRLLKSEIGLDFLTAFFLFSEEGVLEKKLISETGTAVVWKGSVATFGRPISEEQLQKLKLNETRYEDVTSILGPPLVERLTLDGEIIREWIFSREATFSKSGSQTFTASFDYDMDVLRDFVIEDDLPADKKKVARE